MICDVRHFHISDINELKMKITKFLFIIVSLCLSVTLCAQVTNKNLDSFEGTRYSCSIYDNEYSIVEKISFNDLFCEITMLNRDQQPMFEYKYVYKISEDNLLSLYMIDIKGYGHLEKISNDLKESANKVNQFPLIRKDYWISILEGGDVVALRMYRDETNKDVMYIGGQEVRFFIRKNSENPDLLKKYYRPY